MQEREQAREAAVAPARERGLKYYLYKLETVVRRRSRKGAWIEIRLQLGQLSGIIVAPARERGLK